MSESLTMHVRWAMYTLDAKLRILNAALTSGATPDSHVRTLGSRRQPTTSHKYTGIDKPHN